MRTAAIILALHALSAQADIGYTHRKEGTCSRLQGGSYTCSSCPTERFQTPNCDNLCYSIYIKTVVSDGTEISECTQRCGSPVN